MTRNPPRASAAVRDLEPYTSARMLNALDADGIYLDANEAPASFPFTPVDLSSIRHYADDKASLEEAYGAYLGLSADHILAMRGVDEAIDLVIRGFCEPKDDRILAFAPTYGGYAAAAAAHRVELITSPMAKGGSVETAEALAADARVLFLCRPNNPTGSVTPMDQLTELARSVPEDTLIAVDEAYAEFTDTPSALTLLDDYPNIVVMRTMSKAFGLAGAHVGFAIGHPDVIGTMRKIINPYPVPDPCIQLALEALSEEGLRYLEQRVRDNARVRDDFLRALSGVPGRIEVLPSEASFVAARFENALGIYEALRAEKIFIRPLAPMYGEDGWLRFTIGSEQEMRRLLSVMTAESPDG